MEPASPLKSISVPTQQQQPPITNGVPKFSHQPQSDNSLAVLKSIQLTPPAANNRHHHNRPHHAHQNGHVNGFATPSDGNNNFFNQQKNLNEASHGTPSSHNGSIKNDNSEFVADFNKAAIYNSNNSLNSTGSGSQVNGKLSDGVTTNGDLNANFADFDNNKIYNAAGRHYMLFDRRQILIMKPILIFFLFSFFIFFLLLLQPSLTYLNL